MRSSIVLALVWITLACTATGPEAHTEESAPAPEPESLVPPTGAWVVIDELSESRLRVAEVVGIERDRIEVRTIARPFARACAGSLGFESHYELRLFVQPDSLHRVLARPLRVEFDDGTRLELAAGVPVIETGTKGRVRVGETQLVVDLADADVGRWWLPTATDEPTQDPEFARWEPNIELRYGEHRFRAEWPPFLESHAQQELAEGRLLTFESACGRFVLRAEIPDPDAAKGPGQFDPDQAARAAGILGVMQQPSGHFLASPYASGPVDFGDDWGDAWEGLGCAPTKWTASAGTAVSWSGGGDAGVVLVEHELPRNANERDGRVCFEVSKLAVCIESSKLERSGGECELATGETMPSVRQAKAEISEGLDRDIVRRIVRAHVNEVRGCYTKALRNQPTLAGRVAIAFEIGPSGKVTSSKVHETSPAFPDEAVATCIAKAVQRWTFPKPTSGATVSVVYPFVLSPA